MISYNIELLAAPPVSWRILTTLIEIRDNGIVALAVAVVVVGCVRGGRSRSFIPSRVRRFVRRSRVPRGYSALAAPLFHSIPPSLRLESNVKWTEMTSDEERD